MPIFLHKRSNKKVQDMGYHLVIVEALIFAIPFLIILYVSFKENYHLQISHLFLLSVVLLLILAGLLILQQIFKSIYFTAMSLRRKESGEYEIIDTSHDIAELRDISVSFNNLYQKLEQATGELSKKAFELLTIKELTEIAQKSVNIDDLMSIILEKSMAVTGAQIGSVFINEPLSRSFRIVAAKGQGAELKKDVKISIDNSVAKSVVLEKKPLLVQDIEKDSAIVKKNDPKYGPPSFLSMPIFTGDKVSSVLNLACKESREVFDHDDVKILSIMLGEMGFALDNAMLYSKVEEQLRAIRQHNINLEKEIVERKRVEESLRKWAHIFEYAEWGVGIGSADGKTHEMINPAYARMHGYTVEELIGKPIMDIYAPEARAELSEHLHLAEEQGHHAFESVHIRKNGSKFPVIVDMTAVKDKQGHVLYRAVNIQDISERKHAQEALRESEQKFRSIAEQSIVGITVAQHDVLKYVNPKFAEMFGYSVDECMDMPLQKLVTDEDLPFVTEQAKKRITGETAIIHYEYRGIRKKGDIINIEVHASPAFYNNRVASIATHLDITERKKNEARLRLDEIRLESFLKISQYKAKNVHDLLDYALEQAIALTSSKIGYIKNYDELNREFTVITWSKGLKQECHIPEFQSLFKLEKTGIVDEAVRQGKAIIMNELQEAQPLKKGELEGQGKIYKYLAVPVLIEEKVAAVVGVANKDSDYDETDAQQLTLLMDSVWKITVNKKLEMELLAYSQQLEQRVKERTKEVDEANKAKSLFLANMSHELRTPLNSIIGFSEVLEDKLVGPLNESQCENVQYIHHAGKHLLSLINDILDLAKVESGRIEMEYGEVSVREVLDAMAIMQREKALIHGISLSIEISPDADMHIEADERKLKQILFNLLSNAVKFTPDGGSVHVAANKVFDAVEAIEISIIDTGIGIKPEDLPKLFKEFSQLESTYQKKYEGTGLGLALTKRLVELHGGRIWVESESGQGSQFTFVIPIKRMAPY